MNDPSQLSAARLFPHWQPSIGPDPSPAHWPPPSFPPLSRPTWNTPPPAGAGTGGYRPPALKELQRQNRARARRYYPGAGPGARRKFARSAPYAPRNTSSFIMRAKRSGGIPPAPSPAPTPAAGALPTPRFSPSTEFTAEVAREEWGVDGYGSMSGLIRLRSPPAEDEEEEEEEEDEGSSDGGSDGEGRAGMERRMDHDLSRFEMVYRPAGYASAEDDQDAQVARLEEENLTLKERLFLMESEMSELRRRLLELETGRRATELGNRGPNTAASENCEAGVVSDNEKCADNGGDENGGEVSSEKTGND